MNEKQEYAEMLDIVENTCNIRVKKAKPSFFKKRTRPVNSEAVKKELIEKVNSGEVALEQPEVETPRPAPAVKKRKFAVSGVGIGVFAVLALSLTIILTNVLVPNSAINTFFRSVFGSEKKIAEVTDARVFSDFEVAMPYAEMSLENGVITLDKNGSLYSTARGEVETVVKGEDGKYTMLIRHSDNFFTAITGMDYVYFSAGDSVYSTVPVGYSREAGATVCFLDGESAVIANYTIEESAVVWEA